MAWETQHEKRLNFGVQEELENWVEMEVDGLS